MFLNVLKFSERNRSTASPSLRREWQYERQVNLLFEVSAKAAFNFIGDNQLWSSQRSSADFCCSQKPRVWEDSLSLLANYGILFLLLLFFVPKEKKGAFFVTFFAQAKKVRIKPSLQFSFQGSKNKPPVKNRRFIY